MTLLLGNADVTQVLDVDVAIAAMEDAFAEEGRGQAAVVPRADIIMPLEPPGRYLGFKTMSGALARDRVAVARIDVDILEWPVIAGVARRNKVTAAQEGQLRVGKENGLLFLYDANTGELLAIMQDGHVQRLRVGATSAVAAKLLARPGASRVGFFGSGYQAEIQLLALARVRRLDEVCVYSPNAGHREDFARRMAAEADVPVRAVASAEEAAEGADILIGATSSMAPVIRPEWLRPGTHVSCIKKEEIDADGLARCDRIVVTSRQQTVNYVIGEVQGAGADEIDDKPRGWWSRGPYRWDGLPLLSEVLADTVPGRTAADQVTAYLGHGSGIQFAALCNVAYRRASEAGIGRPLPTEWFLQEVYQR